MLNADTAPYFESCPRCGVGGLERLSTHAYCVNCNYEEINFATELCAIPQWAIDALKSVKPKSVVRDLRDKRKERDLELENAV
jgi:hypothetical protein